MRRIKRIDNYKKYEQKIKDFLRDDPRARVKTISTKLRIGNATTKYILGRMFREYQVRLEFIEKE